MLDVDGYQAVRTQAGLFDASALGILELTGRDRAAFLHGLVTNDIQALPRDQACWACTLTPTGHVTSLCLILHRADAHWMIAPRELLPGLQAFLARYLIAEDVRVTDGSEAWQIFGLQGPGMPACVRELTGAPVMCAAQRWQTITRGPTAIGLLGHEPFGVPGVLCVVPRAHGREVWESCERAGARPVGLATFQALRVEAGIAWYGVDADETCLLPETGWERTATSYTKGCYVGQEIVARVASRGQVNRHLAGLILSQPHPPAVPCELLLHDQPCGRLTSAVFSPQRNTAIGIGMVARKAWTAGTPLTVAGQPHLTAEVIELLPLSKGQ